MNECGCGLEVMPDGQCIGADEGIGWRNPGIFPKIWNLRVGGEHVQQEGTLDGESSQ